MQLELTLEGGCGVRPDRPTCLRARRNVPRATFAAESRFELFDNNQGAEASYKKGFAEAAEQYEIDRIPD